MTRLDASLASVILSPGASRIRDDRARAEVARQIREALARRGIVDVETVEAGTPASVRRTAVDAVDRGSSVVVIAGGDGTLRDAAGVLGGSGVAIGIVPCGTGNLFASAIGIPRRIANAIDVLATGDPRPFDIGEVRLLPWATDVEAQPPPGIAGPSVDPAPFIVACGTGLDARLVGATTADMKRRFGVAAYFLATTRLLPHLHPLATVLTIDGVRTALESAVVLVANCGEAIPGHLQPRFPIDPTDGQLHVFVLQGGGLVRGIRGALELMAAQAAGVSPSGAALRLVGRHVRVEVSPAQPTQIDGDSFPAAGLDARIRPGALAVLMAPRHPPSA